MKVICPDETLNNLIIILKKKKVHGIFHQPNHMSNKFHVQNACKKNPFNFND